MAEPWHIGHLRSLKWPAWISSCHKWTRSSLLILQCPAECWPTHKSSENLGALLEYFCSNKKLLISERASSATTWCQMTQWSVAAVAMTLWRCYQGNSVHSLPWWQLRPMPMAPVCLSHSFIASTSFATNNNCRAEQLCHHLSFL